MSVFQQVLSQSRGIRTLGNDIISQRVGYGWGRTDGGKLLDDLGKARQIGRINQEEVG